MPITEIFHGTRKISRAWPFWIAMGLMVQCFTPPNVRTIAETLKELDGNVVPQTWSKLIMEIFKVSWNTQKNCRKWRFYLTICFMVLCIILKNFRQIAEIFVVYSLKHDHDIGTNIRYIGFRTGLRSLPYDLKHECRGQYSKSRNGFVLYNLPSSFLIWSHIQAAIPLTWNLKIPPNGFDFRPLTSFQTVTKTWVCLKDVR